jgi:hypothetical protein
LVFLSGADNLVPGDTNHQDDIFTRDLLSGTTVRVDVSSAGEQSNDQTYGAGISGDGKYVVFDSNASNLVTGAGYGTNVYAHSLASGRTILVDVSSKGVPANGPAYNGSISDTGRYLVFASVATNLVRGITSGHSNTYLRDHASGKTLLVSRSVSGGEADGDSFGPRVSADGRYVTFYSKAANLVAGDTNGTWDAFVRDVVAGTTTRVSMSSSGRQGNDKSVYASISSDGRFVAFTSYASNLVPKDTNRWPDAFLHDMATGRTRRVSVSATGEQGDWWSVANGVSPDGRFVALTSASSNLVPGSGTGGGSGNAFVYDRRSRTIVLVSVDPSGQSGYSGTACGVSSDGGIAVFMSNSPMTPNDKNGFSDVFLREPLSWPTRVP